MVLAAMTGIHGYDSDDRLREIVVPYVAAGLRADEAVVVLVSPTAAVVLRRALGDDAARVRWALPGHDPAWLGRSFAAYSGLVRTRLVVEFGGSPVLKRLAAFRRFDGPWLRLYDARRFGSDVDSSLSPVPGDAVVADGAAEVADAACALGLPPGERETAVRAAEPLSGTKRVWRDGDLVLVRADGAAADSWKFADTVVVQENTVELTFPAVPAASTEDTALAASAFEQGPQLQVMCEGGDLVAVAMNAAARGLLGSSPMGRPLRDWAGEFDGTGQVLDVFREVFNTGIPFTGREWWMRTDTGDVCVNLDVTPWRTAGGEIRGVLGTASVVTELVRAREDAEARYEQTRDVVGQLQRALLPAELPVLPRARIAARYLIAGDEIDAGGDWFDAVPLEGGLVALVVGDVVGHGVAASASMGQLRAVLRERLHAGVSLGAAMVALDRFAGEVAGAHAATVCVVVLDPGSGECEYCTAGHPAPLLVTAEGATRYFEASGAGPLGTGVPMAISHETVPMDAVLVLYSDGILERPGRTPARSTVELSRLAGDVRTGTVAPGRTDAVVELMCELPLELLTRGTGHRDDISLLAVHRVAAPRELDLSVPARGTAVGVVRRELVAWLAEVHAGEDDRFAVTHAVSELVTNSVEHAYPPDEPDPVVRVHVRLLPGGDALVVVSDRGRWQSVARADRGRGHGLAMAADLADSLELERRADGTTATVRLGLRRPARLLSEGAGSPAGFPVPAESAFTVERHGGAVVVAGPLDVDTAPQLRDELLRTTRGGTRGATVDLTAVDHLSSAAVRVLHEAARRAAAQGERLRLVAPAGSTAQQVLALVGLDGLLRPRGLGR